MTDGQPNGYMGLVFAQNKSDLFWQIDEFVDPYAVEVQKAYIGGYCKLLTKISEEDIKTGAQLGQAKSNLSVEELTRAKFFLSKLVDIGLLVKSIDVNQGDKVQLKNLYKNLLQLANIVVNKNVKGIKLNKKIDSAFQGKDILGPNAVDKKENPVKKGPGDIFKEGKKNNFKLR